MTLDENNKKILINHRIEKSKYAIEDVKFAIANDRLIIAVNRIYYGIFYILSALSLKYDFNTSKHQQLIGWFNKNFIKEKILDKKYGTIVRKAFNNRSQGDYSDFTQFTKKQVIESFEEMKKFVNKIEELLKIEGDKNG